MLVVSLDIAFAMPKSISFRCPFTNTKFAGFKSPMGGKEGNVRYAMYRHEETSV